MSKQQLCRTKSNAPRIYQQQQQQQQRIPPPHLQQQQHHHLSVHPQQQQQQQNKSRSFENISAGKALSVPEAGGDSRLWSNQLNLKIPPYTDMSMPPPPPRGPWTSNPPPTASDFMAEPNSHIKLSRQLSLNPSYDARIHPHCPFPPPMDVPPPPPPGHPYHPSITRIASAPEPHQQRLRHHAPPPPIAFVPPTPDHNRTTFIQQQQQQLHKTVSDSWQMGKSSTTSASDWSKDFQQKKALGPIGSPRNSNSNSSSSIRSGLYVHLKAIFSEEQVLSAMAAMPHETDGEKLCTYIIAHKK